MGVNEIFLINMMSLNKVFYHQDESCNYVLLQTCFYKTEQKVEKSQGLSLDHCIKIEGKK